MEIIGNNLSEKGRETLLKKRSFFNLKEQFILDLNREKKKIIFNRGERKIQESYLRKLKFRKKDLESMFNQNLSSLGIIEVLEKDFLEEELRFFEDSQYKRKSSRGLPLVIIFSLLYLLSVLIFCLNFHRLLINCLR